MWQVNKSFRSLSHLWQHFFGMCSPDEWDWGCSREEWHCQLCLSYNKWQKRQWLDWLSASRLWNRWNIQCRYWGSPETVITDWDGRLAWCEPAKIWSNPACHVDTVYLSRVWKNRRSWGYIEMLNIHLRIQIIILRFHWVMKNISLVQCLWSPKGLN